jgi:hypothetical protein
VAPTRLLPKVNLQLPAFGREMERGVVQMTTELLTPEIEIDETEVA